VAKPRRNNREMAEMEVVVTKNQDWHVGGGFPTLRTLRLTGCLELW